MTGGTLRVSWYRFRTTFGRRWGGYLAVVLLVGLIGGIAMASMAGARRTQSSYPAYLASANSSDLVFITSVLNPLVPGPAGTGYDPSLIDAIARLPHVTSVKSGSGLDVLPLSAGGTPVDVAGFPPAAGNGQGSDDGEYFSQDRMTVVAGRMANPARADEIVMDEQVAAAARLHVGQHLRIGIYTNAQTMLPAFGTAGVKPYRVQDVTLVGTVVQPGQVIEDDVDNSQSLAFFTPAFTRPLLACCSNYTQSGVQVTGGEQAMDDVTTRLRGLLPAGFPSPGSATDLVAKAERSVKPESIALGVFGAIAALAALLIAAQVIGRQIRLSATDLGTLRALGAGPATTVADTLVGIAGALVAGALLAAGVAVALSPLSEIGPVASVHPAGVFVDWTVIGGGGGLLIVGLGALAAVLAVRGMPQRLARRAEFGARPSGITRAAANSGMPPAAVAGIGFALEPGHGRNAVPVRSAILGAALALLVVVGTVTFGASLRTLVSHPRLYGWNWDVDLAAGGGSGNAPQHQATQLLDRDRYVQAWSGAYFSSLVIDGQPVPGLGERPGTAVQPPILSGHGLEAPGQVVLGAATLAQLHEHLGGTVVLGTAATGGTRTSLQIVGTATMPTLGAGGSHLEMGTGALVATDLIPPAGRNPFADPQSGPENIFLNLRPGVNIAAAHASLDRIAGALSNNFNFGVAALYTPLRPAEIVNYRAMGTTPAILGAALGAGAAVALGLTLVASVRRRRRDLALLKTLGFTGGQLAATVVWQSTVAVAVGAVVGIPLGIVVGRTLWDVFATNIHAVPAPSVPALSIVLIAVGALVLANLVAAVPGLIAARTPGALALRTE